MIIPIGILDSELKFNFSRSSGPGGQNVNKVNTKAELRFNITTSLFLTDYQKEVLRNKLSSKLNQDGEWIITAQEKRSQIQNKELAKEKFYERINQLLKLKKRRLKTKASASSREKRLKSKKEHSEKKSRRKWNL